MKIIRDRLVFLKKNKVLMICVGFLLFIGVIAALAPIFTHYSFEDQDISAKLQLPSTDHWMGTDMLGRDLYSRIVYGGRLSLAVGLVTALSSLFFGILIGGIAGYRGGKVDLFLMNIVDFLMIFPSILMAILLMLLLGRGVFGIILAIALTSWLTLARQIRGQVMQAKNLPYVEAAKAIGASHPTILFRHIIPNLLGPILVSLTIQIPNNIMAESILSFVGLGLAPPYSSWGTLAYEGFRAMQTYPHLMIFPSLILFLTVFAFNYLGDELRRKTGHS